MQCDWSGIRAETTIGIPIAKTAESQINKNRKRCIHPLGSREHGDCCTVCTSRGRKPAKISSPKQSYWKRRRITAITRIQTDRFVAVHFETRNHDISMSHSFDQRIQRHPIHMMFDCVSISIHCPGISIYGMEFDDQTEKMPVRSGEAVWE